MFFTKGYQVVLSPSHMYTIDLFMVVIPQMGATGLQMIKTKYEESGISFIVANGE